MPRMGKNNNLTPPQTKVHICSGHVVVGIKACNKTRGGGPFGRGAELNESSAGQETESHRGRKPNKKYNKCLPDEGVLGEGIWPLSLDHWEQILHQEGQ